MNHKKTLVLGASLKPSRYSHMAVRALQKDGHEVVAIGGRQGEVGPVWIETEKLGFRNIHTITLYLNPSRQTGYYEYILSLNPRRVIFNPGTENDELSILLSKNQVEVVNDCTLIMLAMKNY